MFRMLAFLAGVITLCFCSTLFLMPQAYYWLAFLLALLLIRICNHFALFSLFSIPTYFKLPLNLIFDISILFLLGMLFAKWQAANQLSTRLPSSLEGSDATVTGTIISIIERRPSQGYGRQDFYQRFLFEVNDFVVDSNGDLVITQLDVGQGSALLISTRDYHLLYDTGPKYSASSNAAHTIIKPYLETMQINRLDTIVVSHGDNDHSGGAEYSSEFSSVKSWLLGGRAEI